MSIQPISTQSSLLEAMSQMQASAGIEPKNIETAIGSVDFSDVFQNAIKGIDNQQHEASAKAIAFETGQSDDLVGTMVASKKAGISFLALTETRNRLLSGLEEIMRMPV